MTFVVDTSSSMQGPKLEAARDGLIQAIDGMYQNNQIGVVTFNDAVNARVPVAALPTNRLKVVDAVDRARAQGERALYDAIKTAIEMTDEAPGEADAIRVWWCSQTGGLSVVLPGCMP